MNFIKKIIKIKDKSCTILYSIIYRFPIFIPSLNDKTDNNIVVSLTTFNPRLSKVYISISSILCQTLKPNKIVLYLGDDVDKNSLPKSLLRLTKKGVEIKFVENIKSHKKYFYAIKDYPNSLIITIDDDLLYPKHMIEKLYKTYQNNPKCICAMRTHQIIYNKDGTPRSYSMWKKNSDKYDIQSSDLFFTSGAGTLFPPNCFFKDVSNLDLIKKLCYSADDVWLNCMSRLNNTKIVAVKVNKYEKRLKSVNGTQKVALKYENLYDEGNDTCINNMISYYNKKIFK